MILSNAKYKTSNKKMRNSCVCLLDELILGFCYSDLTLETGGFELASTITIVLQANQLTKCASHPNISLVVCDIINWLNKNLLTHFVWFFGKEKRYGIATFSVDRVSNKNHFYGKIMHKKLVPDSLLILVNSPKQPLHAINSFKSKIFWNRIIKNF